MNLKIKMVLLLFVLTMPFSAQVNNGVLTIDEEGFRLLKQLSDSRLKGGDILVFTTTHQDLGWLNHIDACVIDRDTLWLTPFIDRLEREKEFKMDIEQTSIVMEYVKRHPEKKEVISRYLKEGRICVGASYIQPYEEMYAGESLARQFYLGSRYMKKEFGGYTPLSYFNVDVPGRTMQMPQIMRKAGVENLIISRHQRGLGYWQSPDGSSVRTYSPGHYIYFYNVLGMSDTAAIKEMAREAEMWYTQFNDVKGKRAVMPAMLNYEFIWDQKPVANCAPFMEKWNSIKAIQTPGGKAVKVDLPKFKYAIADDFFRMLDESTTNLSTIQGERPNVWIYIHGASHEQALTASREADNLLPAAEKVASMATALTEKNLNHYPADRINEAWAAKIYPDHGWGGKNGVQTDARFLEKFRFSLTESKGVMSEVATRLASHVATNSTKGIPIVVINPLSWQREEMVSKPIRLPQGYAQRLEIVHSDGRIVDSQLTDEEWYADGSIRLATLHFIAAGLPSMGLTTYYLRPSVQSPSFSPCVLRDGVDNQFYKVELADGGIRQITDHELGVDLLETSKFLGGEIITMRSIGNGAGEFDAVQQPDMEGFDKTTRHSPRWRVVEDGALFTSFKYRSPIRHAVIEQTMRVFHTIKRIDFEVSILNWEEVLYREFRMMFPLAMPQAQVRYEVPYGILQVGKDEMEGVAGERYQVPNKEIRPRGIGNWISAEKGEVAVTIGSSVVTADYVDPTPDPLSSSTVIQPILMASRKSCHGEGNEYLQPGDHHFRFSLTSHRPDPIRSHQFGSGALHMPVVVLDPGRFTHASLPEILSFVEVNNPNLVVSALKKSEDDNNLILRLYNLSDQPQKADLTMNRPPKSIRKVNLIEEEIEEVQAIELGGYAIETFKLIYE